MRVVNDYLTAFAAPVIAVQEAIVGHVALARALEWNLVGGPDTAILSPLPLEPVDVDLGMFASAAIVSTDRGEVLVWSVHLDYRDFGPYFVPNEHPRRVDTLFFEQMRAQQGAQVLAASEAIARSRGDRDLPVVIAGDFNVPSTNDWAQQRRADGATERGLRWTATDQMRDNGYEDAFRAVWPDANAVPGETWSPLQDRRDEPRERIDFVFARGLTTRHAAHLGAKPIDAPAGPDLIEVRGPAQPIPLTADNAWPSDHLGVVAQLAFPSSK